MILSKKFQTLLLNLRAQKFADQIILYVSEESVKAKQYERLLGSSEIIESLIGLVKHHSNTQSRSGFTSSILIAAALTGKIDEQTVLNAMTNINVAKVNEWEKTYFESTIQKKRAKFYQQTPLYQYVDIDQIGGTENGTYLRAHFDPETG